MPPGYLECSCGVIPRHPDTSKNWALHKDESVTHLVTAHCTSISPGSMQLQGARSQGSSHQL